MAPLATAKVEELWRDFSTPLKAFLRARTRSDADADDLLQEVFTRIHRNIGSLHDASKLQGWVYRIARNAVVDYYRSRRPEEPINDEFDAEDPSGREAVDLTPTLKRFIAALPVAYREPLVRYEFQGESLQVVADSLGLTLTAVKSRVRRARHMLREMLDRCCAFEFDRLGRVISATPKSECGCDSCADRGPAERAGRGSSARTVVENPLQRWTTK